MLEPCFCAPAFAQKLSVCFAGGEIRRRELRLTPRETDFLRANYPVTLRPMGRDWYDIQFLCAKTGTCKGND